MSCQAARGTQVLESLTAVRADALQHARSRANGGNVHRVESTIQAYVFACECLQRIKRGVLLEPGSPAVRRRLVEARADVQRIEAQLWAV